MTDRLFIYGTLGPGRPNEHVMKAIGGRWQRATVTGSLREAGWGAGMGYPGIDLDGNEDVVDGFLFTSDSLSANWDDLDAFEGEGYKRQKVSVTLEDGSVVDAFIYALA